MKPSFAFARRIPCTDTHAMISGDINHIRDWAIWPALVITYRPIQTRLSLVFLNARLELLFY